MVMGGVCFSLALVLGIPLVISGGWVILAIGLVSLLMGYAYTGGPYPLAYRGLGDIFVIIFFGWVAVGGMVYLHCHTYTWHAWVAGTQVGCLATVLIAINNLRDHKGDRDVGKLTLAVRFGAGFARFEIGCLLLVPIFLSLYWYGQGFWFAAGLPLMLVPLVVKILVGVWRNSPGLVYNSFLAQAALLHLLFGIFLAIGFLLS
jgi:1,4-dihydroxy-2-naphthoate octaprenyltransferase